MDFHKAASFALGALLLSSAPATSMKLRGSISNALVSASLSKEEESSCANRALDVMFVVDHSRSMSGNVAWRAGDTCGGGCKCAADNSCKGKDINPCDAACGAYYWESTQAYMRGFVKNIVKEFRDHEAENSGSETTRFSWVGFNNIPNGAIEEWTLEQGSGAFKDVSELIDGSFTQYAPDTCMQTGLEHVYNEWAPGTNGNRVDSPDVIVMITDGAYFCGNKGNCVKDGVRLDKRDPACAIDAASKLRARGTTFFSVDILQWTCPFATSYSECLGVSDQGRAELMSELAGEKGCVPAGAPESKRIAARMLTKSDDVPECKQYMPVLQFSSLNTKVKEIFEDVCVVVPPIDPIIEETNSPTPSPTEPKELPCNPIPDYCPGRYVCEKLKPNGKHRCADTESECIEKGYGVAVYSNEACPTPPPTSPFVTLDCNPLGYCDGRFVCEKLKPNGRHRCADTLSGCKEKNYGEPIYSNSNCATDAPTASPTVDEELPCNPTTRCSGKYMCSGRNGSGKRKCVQARDDCGTLGFGEAIYDNKFCPVEPLPCNPLGRCDGRFVCSKLKENGLNRCVKARRDCVNWGWGAAIYSNEACATPPPTEPIVTIECNPIPDYCPGRYVCEKLKPNGKHRCADTFQGCEEKNYGNVIYGTEACTTVDPTEEATERPTTSPTEPATESPTTALTEAPLVTCPSDGVLPIDFDGFALITEGDANVASHTFTGGVSIGGTLFDESPNEHASLNDFSYFGEGYTGRWNFNAGMKVGWTPWMDSWSKWENVASDAISSSKNGYRVIVVTEGGSYHQGSFGACLSTKDLLIFNTAEKVTLTKGQCGGDFKFLAAVIAPFSHVVLEAQAHFAESVIVAKTFEDTGGQLQLHGHQWNGIVECDSGN